ncbi:MAG: hypothetical protein LBE46_05115 [Wolbachia pipientis]|jgi:hypothetical protein|nr:hypothetical protein [Wolbachia pipientis]
MSTSNLKISITALSLCVSAVAIYIHLPYVIAAVSGSGAIEAVSLAIVALVSVIYLIRLAVSKAGDKKKIDLSGEESSYTASLPSPSGGAPPPPVPSLSGKLDATLSNDNNKQKMRRAEYYARVDRLLTEAREKRNCDNILEQILMNREMAILLSGSDESDHPNNWTSSGDEHVQIEPDQAEKELTKHTNPPSSKEKSCGSYSGVGSRATPLLEKLPILPDFRVDSPSTAQVNNVGPVNSEIQDSSALPVKEHIKPLSS